MATGITVGVRFSDGSIAYLANADVTTGAVGEEILTANQGGDLAQTANVSIGQAYTGKVATHAFATVATQNASTARLLWANFRGPDGAVIVPINGGGIYQAVMVPLYKPVTMTTGVVVHAAWQAASDSATLIAAVSVCSPSKCDTFTATAVDGSNTELKNKDNATIGQSMNGLTADKFYGVYPSTLGLNENLGGVSCLFVTASDGALKALIPASDGSGYNDYFGTSYPVRILQNDGLFVNSDS